MKVDAIYLSLSKVKKMIPVIRFIIKRPRAFFYNTTHDEMIEYEDKAVSEKREMVLG